MKKKKSKKQHFSYISALFHKPLLLLFIIASLPFIAWGTQQTQLFISLGNTQSENISQKLNPQQQSSCPQTSSQSYTSLNVISDFPKPNISAEQNPEINMLLRGYEEINEKLQLIDYGGDTDPVMPPSLGTMFTKIPAIVKTYKVHKWDYAKNSRSPELESNWPVNLIGLSTSPAEPLMGPKAGREIGGGNVLMLIYASPTTATFVHGRGENPQDGYFIHMDNFCVDPNLLASYQSSNSSGRTNMPVIRTGQVFGYGNGADVRIAIRDSGDWMDPRARKDWWQESDAYVGVPLPTSGATQVYVSASPTGIPSPTQIFIPSPSPIPTIIPTRPQTASPTQTITYVFVSPTKIPTPTPTPTPTPSFLAKIKSNWDNLLVTFFKFTKTILP